MPRILIVTERPERWDAILPLLPWLADAGAELRVSRGQTGIPAQVVRELAESLDVDEPVLKRSHAGWGSRFDLLLGTVDDLPQLKTRPETPYVALARLPVPATLLSEPVPPPLHAVVQESVDSQIGAMLTGQDASGPKELRERTDNLPFLVTGCLELDGAPEAGPAGRFVVLHPGDLIEGEDPSDESLKRHVRALERLLTPLLALDRPIQIRTALWPGPHQDAESLREALRYIAEQHKLDTGRVEIQPAPGWNDLSSARGVITLSHTDALRAIAAGTARVWYLPFVRGLVEDVPVPSIPGMTISSWARFARWVEERGWQTPTPEARNTARTLAVRRDGRAAERAAQLIMSVAEWDWNALDS